MSRPSDYTPEIADAICERIASGETLRSLARDEAMPARSTMRLWLLKHEAFSAQYARACDARADVWADEIMEISDDSTNDYMDRKRADGSMERAADPEHIQRSKLRIDARRWLMGKAAPKRYGDKLAIGGDADAPPVRVELDDSTLARRLLFLLEKGAREG